mmetsp:Transcript_52559/g.170785  ORF Transcript_52559/g.170785 Transcript_52559/m.170785 type:complete len:209 (-) Transcript_52559:576-1202(-)
MAARAWACLGHRLSASTSCERTAASTSVSRVRLPPGIPGKRASYLVSFSDKARAARTVADTVPSNLQYQVRFAPVGPTAAEPGSRASTAKPPPAGERSTSRQAPCAEAPASQSCSAVQISSLLPSLSMPSRMMYFAARGPKACKALKTRSRLRTLTSKSSNSGLSNASPDTISSSNTSPFRMPPSMGQLRSKLMTCSFPAPRGSSYIL